jgi:hypothetical protein
MLNLELQFLKKIEHLEHLEHFFINLLSFNLIKK